MVLMGERVFIKPMTLDVAQELYELRKRNQEFFTAYEPYRPESFTLDWIRADIERFVLAALEDKNYALGIYLKETNELIGRITVNIIARGIHQGAHIGYYIGQEHNGKGYMTEAVRLTLKYAFDVLDLHRVEANVMPRNKRSARVLEKVGFRYEGLCKGFLKINDVWEDHDRYAMTVEEYRK
ncbi:GNAT family protein [Tumebacillus sp. DT12]|uniref:GNAT family protein n=1 Tax=Tumebacillus lacus TaxID=2995335 RepID=A0ABT3WVP0_9BACL|nr:GNAT family protein [Tumebacillus lacus]MCX7568666.1 GNAT family protein [Tumebacillus lacus]